MNPFRFNSRKYLKRLVVAFICVMAIWILGDFIYSRATLARIDRWETTIERNVFGVQLGHETFEIDGSENNGTIAILMVHGINDSPYAYRKIAPALANRGYFCRAIRLPGFAKPIREYARSQSIQWTNEIQSEIVELKKTHRQVFVMAHSLGGAATIQAQLQQPTEIDGLILLAPAIEVSNARSPLLPTRFWHDLGMRMLYFTQIVESPFAIDANDPVERNRKDRIRFGPINVIDETFKLIDGNRGRATEITTPILMVLTRQDKVIDYRSCEKYFEELGSTNKQLFYQDRSGHALPYDYGWETIVERAAQFIEEIIETK